MSITIIDPQGGDNPSIWIKFRGSDRAGEEAASKRFKAFVHDIFIVTAEDDRHRHFNHPILKHLLDGIKIVVEINTCPAAEQIPTIASFAHLGTRGRRLLHALLTICGPSHLVAETPDGRAIGTHGTTILHYSAPEAPGGGHEAIDAAERLRALFRGSGMPDQQIEAIFSGTP